MPFARRLLSAVRPAPKHVEKIRYVTDVEMNMTMKNMRLTATRTLPNGNGPPIIVREYTAVLPSFRESPPMSVATTGVYYETDGGKVKRVNLHEGDR